MSWEEEEDHTGVAPKHSEAARKSEARNAMNNKMEKARDKVCHKCGQKIRTFFTKEEMESTGGDITKLEEKLRGEGYEIGYDSKHIGSYGNIREVPQKPICRKCSTIKLRAEKEKKTKKQMRKIVPILKKVYVCPVTTFHGECMFKTPDKKTIINHIKETHSGDDLDRMVGE